MDPTRAGIAAALNAAEIRIGGRTVTATATRPTILGPGCAWPKVTLWDRDQAAGGYVRTWAIFVIVPTDEVSADNWMDEHLGDIDAALAPVVYVDRYEPIYLAAEGGELPAVQITAHSE